MSKLSSDMKIIDLKGQVLNKNIKITNKDPAKSDSLKFYPALNAIYIPDHTLKKLYEKENKEKNPYFAKLEIESILTKNDLLKANKTLNEFTLAIFYLLHEEGHYNHFNTEFLSQGLNSEIYLNRYNNYMDVCAEKLKKTCGTNQDDKAFQEWAKLYRENPFETIADTYALKKIKEQSYLLTLFK